MVGPYELLLLVVAMCSSSAFIWRSKGGRGLDAVLLTLLLGPLGFLYVLLARPKHTRP